MGWLACCPPACAQALLTIDSLPLYVETWTSGTWDRAHARLTHGAGTGRLAFDCQSPVHVPFAGNLRLVEYPLTTVRGVASDPSREIGVADALLFDSRAIAGYQIVIQIPAGLTQRSQLVQAIQAYISWRRHLAGGTLVRLADVTVGIQPGTGLGLVTAGRALYPAANPNPEPAAFSLSGFAAPLNSLVATPTQVQADAVLQMPVSISDPGTGHPGQVALGGFPINKQCTFHKNLPSVAYGPWAVGSTEMEVKGVGVVADFDATWASPLAQTGTPAAAPSWQGALLGPGTTVGTQLTVVSNSGYLRAQYTHSWAQVASAGLSAQFTLAHPFAFSTIEPFGYEVQLRKGSIGLQDSAVFNGYFVNSTIVAPSNAASGENGGLLIAVAKQLELDSKLGLAGFAAPPPGIAWGGGANGTGFYRAHRFLTSGFFLSGSFVTNYFPLNNQDQYTDPPTYCNPPSSKGPHGLTLCFPAYLEVDTLDTPTASPLQFVPINADDATNESWLNVSANGVHGEFLNFVSQAGSNLDLGPTTSPYYVGVTPFKAALITPTATTPAYYLSMQFIDSAVYDAQVAGAVNLPKPVDSNLNFMSMELTSTAEISGAAVPLFSPLPLSYWGLTVQRNRAAPLAAGVLSARTGEVLITAAGIAEPRHFRMPIPLTWGEILADGQVQKLTFDYDSRGQQFDGFYHVPSFVTLSPYDPSNTQPYLKVAGQASFDFFGSKYINLNDASSPTTGPPYDGRQVTLMDDSDPQGAFGPTDHSLNANWSNGLGTFTFTYNYDASAQDGFVGSGQIGLLGITGNLPSSIVLKADPRICVSASDSANHDLALGPVAQFATIGNISGCGCVNNGQFERLVLSAQLEADANANVFVKSASYGSVQMMLTPTLSDLGVQGDMFLDVAGVGNVEVSGSANFSLDRSQAAVDGNVDGHFDTSSMLGFNSLSADGQLDWHAAAPVSGSSYHSLQGKLAISVVTPVGGSGVEGGLYLGVNAPKSDAWVLNAGGPKFQLNTAALPDVLTGVYGYAKFSESLNLWVVSGGIEAYTGLGGFVLPANFPIGTINAVASGGGIGLPYVIGNDGVHVWGSVLGGLGSADGWVDLNLITPYPFSYQGTLGLQVCGAWGLVCESADVTVGLNSANGLFAQ